MFSPFLYFLQLRKIACFLLLLLSITHLSVSQDKCGTVPYEKLLKDVRSKNEDQAHFEKWLRCKIQSKSQKMGSFSILSELEENVVYTIPVVVHVIHNGEPVGQGSNISISRILSQIDILNKDFRRLNADTTKTPAQFQAVAADTRIEFVLAKRDPEGLSTNGVVRVEGPQNTYAISDNWELKSYSYWPAEDYLNIWVAPLHNTLLGFAQFPQSDTEEGLEDASAYELTDGVVIDHEYFGANTAADPVSKGRTATHEIGHFLGLKHIWGDGGCDVDDFVEDTPLSDGANYNCPSSKVMSCGNEDMFQNYMDYTNDGCMNLFTLNQRDRMHAVLQNSPRRASLVTSKGKLAPAIVSNDLGIKKILSPEAVACDKIVVPELLVRNYGDNDIFNFKVRYSLNGELVDSIFQSVTLSPLDSIKISFTSLELGVEDEYYFEFEIVEVNNDIDANPDNNLKKIALTIPEQTLLPIYENFEVMPFAGTIYNPDEVYGWQWEVAPENEATNKALKLNFFDYQDSQGERDFFYTNVFDFVELESAKLSFKVAYAEYSGGSDDGLIVAISTDCGYSYPTEHILYEAYGRDLATAKATSSAFTPQGRLEWKKIDLDLDAYVGMENLRIAFIGVNDYGNNLYLDQIRIDGEPDLYHDLMIHEFKAPPILCSPTFTPAIAIVNKGQTTVNSFKLNISSPSIEDFSYTYNQTSIAPLDTVTVTLPQIHAENDLFTLNLSVQLPEGIEDDFPENNFKAVQFIVDTTREDLPFRESFSLEDTDLLEWFIYNPDNSNTWDLVSTPNTGKDKAIFLNNYDYQAVQERDWLISPLLDFTNREFVNMTFNFSYAYNFNYLDKLQVLVSTDCGMSYANVAFEASGEELSETYAPTAWDPEDKTTWQKISVSLNDYIGEENVRIAFVMNNGYGNNFYLDDIEFFVSEEPEKPLPTGRLYAFPNPVSNNLPIIFSLEEKEIVTIGLYDTRGKLILKSIYPNTLNQVYDMEIHSLPAGVYFLKIAGETFNDIKRLLITK